MTFDLHLGDCLDVLRTLPDDSVDAVITDPPFGIGFRYDGVRETHKDPESYWAWLKPRYAECLRILRPGGLVAIWQAQIYFRHFWNWFGDDIHIYCAAKNFVQLNKTAINYGYDPVIMRYKPGITPLRPINPKRNVDFFVANTAGIISCIDRIEKAHPCPRPLDAVATIVGNFALPYGTILDPFMGSGTTGIASLRSDHSFIGIESDPTYFTLAQTRIAAAQISPPLLSQSHLAVTEYLVIN